MVQWLRHLASTAGGTGLIPGRGTKIPHAVPKINKQINNFLNWPRRLQSARHFF